MISTWITNSLLDRGLHGGVHVGYTPVAQAAAAQQPHQTHPTVDMWMVKGKELTYVSSYIKEEHKFQKCIINSLRLSPRNVFHQSYNPVNYDQFSWL